MATTMQADDAPALDHPRELDAVQVFMMEWLRRAMSTGADPSTFRPLMDMVTRYYSHPQNTIPSVAVLLLCAHKAWGIELTKRSNEANNHAVGLRSYAHAGNGVILRRVIPQKWTGPTPESMLNAAVRSEEDGNEGRASVEVTIVNVSGE